MDPVGFTSRLTAAARARESERPDRLFHDEFATALAGREGFDFLDRHWVAFEPCEQSVHEQRLGRFK